MIEKPMDVLTAHPVRKGKRRKQAFREDLQSYLHTLGYEMTVEKGQFGSRNVVIGNPESAQYLVTAHYDTCATLPVPNLITPCNFGIYLAYQLFLVLVMFAFTGVGGSVMYLVTKDGGLAFWTAYVLLWVFLALLMAGPANRHNANDNTSGVVTVLEIARALPEAQRGEVCFVLFDLEEAGLLGSASYRKMHREQTNHQIVLNLDCVGDGDEILLFPTGKLRKDKEKMSTLRTLQASFGEKGITLREKGLSIYPSDQASFPYGVGIAALHRSKWAGLYMGRIHTSRDTILEEENVNILRTAILKLFGCGAAEIRKEMQYESV
ncbi:MAG: M28 family metallopeptidase [Faecousia sp.]